MLKKIVLILLVLPLTSIFGSSFVFPHFNVYSEMNSTNTILSSYQFDMLIDTGLKYGVKIGLGFKDEQFTSMTSNFINLDSIKVYANPTEQFTLGYFLGKNLTLGYMDIGYNGFQFHQKPDFEYFGYKDINGTGVEGFSSFFDNLLEPHLYIYQPNNTNLINLDSVTYFRMENYIFELYAGINNINLYDAIIAGNLQKRFGLNVKTVFGKIDFLLGLYMPDSGIFEVPPADAIYLNVTEHIIYQYFEQTLSLFTRPREYNGLKETITNDVDFYLAAGARFDRVADAHIGAAAADIARHRRIDIGIVGVRRTFEQRRRGHDLTGLAITALDHFQIEPGLLHLGPGRR